MGSSALWEHKPNGLPSQLLSHPNILLMRYLSCRINQLHGEQATRQIQHLLISYLGLTLDARQTLLGGVGHIR